MMALLLEEEFDFRLRSSAGKWKDAREPKKYKPKSFKRNSPYRSLNSGSYVKQSQFWGKQNVTIKSYISKGKNSGAALQKHTDYLLREKTGLDGDPPKVFFRLESDEKSDPNAFIKRAQTDPHHFRFIISPEFGRDMDLEKYTQELMEKVRVDLNAEIDWIAVEHHNTNRPHAHVVLRGWDLEKDQPLYLHPQYLNRWMRHRAEHEATRVLGARDPKQNIDRNRREQRAGRYTSFDKTLLSMSQPSGFVDLNHTSNTKEDDLNLLKRLQTLRKMELAVEVERNVWVLRSDLEARLRREGRKKDIVRTLIASRYESFSMEVEGESGSGFIKSVPKNNVSIVLSMGAMNDLDDKRYALCETSDGSLHYVTSEQVNFPDTLKRGSVVRFEQSRGPKFKVLVLDERSPEAQITKNGLTWLDSLDEKTIDRTRGTFKKVVKEAWEERQMFLFEHGIAPIKLSLIPKNVSDVQKSTSNFRKVEHEKSKAASTSVHESAPNDVENHTNFRKVEHEKSKTASTSVQESASTETENGTAAVESREGFRKITNKKKSEVVGGSPVIVHKTPPPIPELAKKKTVHDASSVSENIAKRQEDIEKWSLDTLKNAIRKRTNKTFVPLDDGYNGVISSHHGEYSVIERGDTFTLLNRSELPKSSSDRVEKGAYRRIIVKREALKGETTCFVQPPSSQPAKLSEAMNDLKYIGQTWLDEQFNNPSPVVAPTISRNLDMLKRERLAFLVSVGELKEGEIPPTSFIKNLRKLERNKFVEDIKERSKLGYLRSADKFSGRVSKERKLRGGTYIVVSNRKNFVVLQADKFLRKQIGKDVTLSKAKDKNGRIRFKAGPDKSKDRGGR